MTALRTLRESAGMTQEKLARKVHMSECELGNVERGYRLPWPHEARAIADVFVVAVETLFPDGFKLKKDWGRYTKEERCYLPPDESEPVVPRVVLRYPKEFTVLCYRCRKQVPMRADDCHAPEDEDPKCPECGARFYQIVPLEEAARP
jgi:transcriptional regulator with XRE-family HTH domain